MDGARFKRLTRAVLGASRLAVRSPRDAALAVRMVYWLLAVSVLARVLSLPRAQQVVSAPVRETAPADVRPTAERLATAIDRLLALDLWMLRPSCWRRAIVLNRFLALEGIATRIQFGVRPTHQGLAGHAWLDRDGQPFLEHSTDSHVVTFSLPLTPPKQPARGTLA